MKLESLVNVSESEVADYEEKIHLEQKGLLTICVVI